MGPTERVDRIFELGRDSVAIAPDPAPPRELPAGQWTYWKVDRNSHVWHEVEESLNLGVRFADDAVETRVDGEKTVSIRSKDGSLIGFSLSVFALPVGSQP